MKVTTPAHKKLPIGIQTFSEIIQENHYYVDKTPYAVKMACEGKYYFLSRPRRFGKSLFIDTLKELFEGNKTLFKGLYAETHWNWQVRHPVIRISFSDGVLKNSDQLTTRIRILLSENAERLGLNAYDQRDIPGQLSALIRSAHQKFGAKAVVLIDEYDKPILDNITTPAIATDMREGLKNLYSAIKGADADLRFVMLTGVSKFSKVSLFSGLNNLEDITLSAPYSAICGYTDHDVDHLFSPELQGLDRQQIRDWYNGYNWLGESVYNPFDLLLLFRERKFRPWWFETGTPTFLVQKLADEGVFSPDLKHLKTGMEILSTFDVDNITPEALLFQAGYLTIQSVDEPLPGQWFYTLGYPNQEVESSLNGALLAVYSNNPSQSFQKRIRLLELLNNNDFEGLRTLFTAFYASIPHHWYDNNPVSRYEGYYASVFYSYFAALGLQITLEDVTHHGRIDMTVHFKQQVYLFEFKVVETAPKGNALQQLKHKSYADKYRALNQPIHLIGIEFSQRTRSVVGFDVELITPA